MGQRGFFAQVYDIVERIPPGKVATYGQIAMMTGHPRGARVVGYALRVSPENRSLPCHRVVNRLGELAPEGVFGSKELQRSMLEQEGITFLPSGHIDMKKHIWQGQID